MSKEDNFKGNGFKTRFGQSNGNDNTIGGRKVSIKNAFKKILKGNGKMIIPKENILSIDKDGNVIIKVPTDVQLALKLLSIATGKSANNLAAIKIGMEQVDGKPRQSFDFDYKEVRPMETLRLDPKKVNEEQDN